ncbi:hypothetical protein llap_8889 [Limosa lapponica baueri]|uniref:Uncharacterized protein n=1 Tax=Limosa lapponica baueri TaxID=1758121 RepID=A0A2I0U427_LIMLA|nr:hypothetical protein llap_8889 [Limosa lapponica baueri]
MGRQRRRKEQDVSKQAVSVGRENEDGKSPTAKVPGVFFSSLLAAGFPQDPEARCMLPRKYFWPGILFMILNDVPVIGCCDTKLGHNGNVKKNLKISTPSWTEINACRNQHRDVKLSEELILWTWWAYEAAFPISESKEPIEYSSF